MKQRWEFMKENFNKKVKFKKIERKHALVRDSLITILLKRSLKMKQMWEFIKENFNKKVRFRKKW